MAADWSLISFIFQSSFTNQHVLIDSISKTSHLDIMLINSSSVSGMNASLFDTLMGDISLQTSSVFFPLSCLLQTEYQDTVSTTLLVSPELSMVLRDYVSTYWLAATFNNLPTAAFDSYTNNLNYFPGEGMISFMLFGLYV